VLAGRRQGRGGGISVAGFLFASLVSYVSSDEPVWYVSSFVFAGVFPVSILGGYFVPSLSSSPVTVDLQGLLTNSWMRNRVGFCFPPVFPVGLSRCPENRRSQRSSRRQFSVLPARWWQTTISCQSVQWMYGMPMFSTYYWWRQLKTVVFHPWKGERLQATRCSCKG
jgi:hypothetical protein